MTTTTKGGSKRKVEKQECKFNLSVEAKQKISFLARDLKINQSELMDKLIQDLDATKQILENISYIISREKVFEDVAKLVRYQQLMQENFKIELAKMSQDISDSRNQMNQKLQEVSDSNKKIRGNLEKIQEVIDQKLSKRWGS